MSYRVTITYTLNVSQADSEAHALHDAANQLAEWFEDPFTSKMPAPVYTVEEISE